MKFLKIAGMWLVIILVYIIFANVYPVFSDLTDVATAGVISSGNMTNQPGIVDGLQLQKLVVWFIPAGVGLLATVVYLREGDTGRY